MEHSRRGGGSRGNAGPGSGAGAEKEETGLDVEVGPLLDVFDRITRDANGRTRYHYVIVDFLCQAREGSPIAGSDVSEVALVGASDLGLYDLTPKTLAVIQSARRLSAAT